MSRALATGSRKCHYRAVRAAPLIAAALAFTSGGCISDNQDYRPDLGSSRVDLSPRPPDLTPPPTCVPPQRECATPTSAATCQGGKWAIDIYCPSASMCSDGYCRVPPVEAGTPQGLPCTSETDCFSLDQNYSCEPFVVGGMLAFFCARAVGSGGSAVPCTTPNDCRTGRCLWTNDTCFRLCTNDADCPARNGVHLVCKPVPFNIEDLNVTARSCVSPN